MGVQGPLAPAGGLGAKPPDFKGDDMKTVKIYIAFALLVFMALGCSMGQDKPSKADMDKTLKDIHLQDFTIDKTDYAGKDKDGKYNVGVWGQAKDLGADINFFAVLKFEKKGSEWAGTVPAFGLIAEPLSDNTKENFYKNTSPDWEKLKEKIKSGK
jgi:hypothetical protein